MVQGLLFITLQSSTYNFVIKTNGYTETVTGTQVPQRVSLALVCSHHRSTRCSGLRQQLQPSGRSSYRSTGAGTSHSTARRRQGVSSGLVAQSGGFGFLWPGAGGYSLGGGAQAGGLKGFANK